MTVRSSSQQPYGITVPAHMANAIGSSRESNPSRGICHLRALPLGPVANATYLRKNQRNLSKIYFNQKFVKKCEPKSSLLRGIGQWVDFFETLRLSCVYLPESILPST